MFALLSRGSVSALPRPQSRSAVGVVSERNLFPAPDAPRVALVGPETLRDVAETLSAAQGMTVESLDRADIPDDLLVAETVPDCVVTTYPTDRDVIGRVLDRPVVVYADLPDDAVATLVDADDVEYVPTSADTPNRDLLADRIRKLARAYRRESELSLRAAAMDQAGVGITIADAQHSDQVLVYANEGFEAVTGYDAATAVGRNCRFLQGPDTDPDTVAEIRAAIAAEESVSVDLLNYDDDDDPFWNQLDIAPVEDDDGEVTHYFGFQKEITERKRLEERLERENERLSTFANVVSHDLRNPLGVARGAATALSVVDLPDDARSELDRMETAFDRMETLVEDVLALARQGKVVDDPEPTSVPTVVSGAWAAVDASAATLELDDDLGVIRADPERLQALFENLFRNAVEHVGPNVSVTVGAVCDGFYVEDDGPGIPPDGREEVFDQGYTTDDDGTGFGLAIVDSVASAHGWSVAAEAGSSGGARFVVSDVETP